MATKRPDGRVEPGQRISSAFSARAWNRAQDAADMVLGARTGATAGENDIWPQASNIVLVRNAGGRQIPMFGVMALGGMVVDPSGGALDGTGPASAKAREFARRPLFESKALFNYDSSNAYAIALEPIRENSIGRAAIDGVVQCRLEIITVNDRWVNLKTDSHDELKTGSAGTARILWKESGTGSGKWGVIRLGSYGGIRLGKVSQNWQKGATATVAEHDGDGNAIANQTFQAINRFGTVLVNTPKWVACDLVGEQWHLIAAEC